jgi:hypothetical protein
LFSDVTFKGWPGSSMASSRRMASRLSVETAELGRTVMLKNWRPPRVSQMIRLVSPGALPLTMISVGVTAEASAISPRPMATRAMGRAQSIRTVLPTATATSFVES